MLWRKGTQIRLFLFFIQLIRDCSDVKKPYIYFDWCVHRLGKVPNPIKRLYTAREDSGYHSICIFWTDYSLLKPPCLKFEPHHAIMAFFVLHKLILQTRMSSHPVGLDVWFFVYFHTSCVQTASPIISWAGSFRIITVIISGAPKFTILTVFAKFTSYTVRDFYESS